MKIRSMNQNDFDQVYDIWKQLPLDIAEYEQEKRLTLSCIKHNPTTCLVGEVDGQIIGAVLGTFDGMRGWFNHLGIHPDYQGKGYGKALFKATEKALIKRGALKLDLFVEKTNNEMTTFYKEEGYEIYDEAVLVWKNIKSLDTQS